MFSSIQSKIEMNNTIPNITHKPIIIKTDSNILIPIILFKIRGGREIRTPETLRPAGFQDQCFNPLSHTSNVGIVKFVLFLFYVSPIPTNNL